MNENKNKVQQHWRRTLISSRASLQEAAQNLTESALRIVLVTDGHQQRLLGTLSDGDIRRGLLRGLTLGSPIEAVMNPNPLVVPEGITPELVRQIMSANKIHQVPEVDSEGRIIGLHTWDDFEISAPVDAPMVIMAGGKGTRLRPHTVDCPKPMLPIRGKPMLAHIIDRAKAEGFHRFVISLNYLGHVIEDYFGDGRPLGINIDYLRETAPMGTAGSLSLFESTPDRSFVVTNGDVLTDIRYADILDFHTRHAADATMAVRLYEWHHPFGVVEMDGLTIVGFEEKPVARTHINAGVYVLSPGALDLLKPGESCDMPKLFERLQEKGGRTIAYPMHEPWLDVGRPDDLKAANVC
jgi:dTDP-glucose pyrophosphorylase